MPTEDRPEHPVRPPKPEPQGDGQEAGAPRPKAPEQQEPPRPHGDPNADLVPGNEPKAR